MSKSSVKKFGYEEILSYYIKIGTDIYRLRKILTTQEIYFYQDEKTDNNKTNFTRIKIVTKIFLNTRHLTLEEICKLMSNAIKLSFLNEHINDSFNS